MDYRYIILEGPVGVGKTAVMEMLAQRLGVEPDRLGATDDPFLVGDDAWFPSLPFQTRMHDLLVRFRHSQILLGSDLFSRRVLSDHLFEIAALYARLHLTTKELDLYDQYYQILSQRILKPDLVIYLRASTDVLWQRLRLAGHDSVAELGREHIDRINLAFQEFFDNYDDAPLHVIDTDDFDYVNVPRDFDAFCMSLERDLQMKIMEPPAS